MVRRSLSILRPRKYIASLHHKFVNVCSVEALSPARKSSLISALSESTEIAPSPTLSAIFKSRPALLSYCCASGFILNLRCAAPVSVSVRDCTASSQNFGQSVLSQRFSTMAESNTDMSQVTVDTSTHQKVDRSSSRANEAVNNATAKDSQDSHAPRFAIFTTGYAPEYTANTYGGYGPLFMKLLSDPGEVWDEIFVVEGKFPSEEELEKYDGFVITGSRHDAHGNEAWIEKLCTVLQRIHEKRKKMLGVCFGHQVLSRALGGKTGRAPVGWEVGLRDISLTDAIFTKPYGVGLSPIIKVLEVHRDQVSQLPPGAELLGSSPQTGIEMFSVGEHILAIQGHPEFFDDVVYDILDGRLAAVMTEEQIRKAKETLGAAKADQELWRQLCKEFLKGRKS